MHKRRVLVVSDNHSSRADIAGFLNTRNELEAYQADDGIDALLKVYSTCPQVLIWAMERPDYWGSECLMHIKRHQPRMGVISLDDLDHKNSFSAAAATSDRVLSRKGLSHPVLLQCVEELCRSAVMGSAERDWPRP